MKHAQASGREAAYFQIYALLREKIVSGVYPHDSRLPSKRLLAEELSVSTVTVAHAYALLCDEGYACARERSGFFVSFRRSDGFAATQTRAVSAQPQAAPPTQAGFSIAVLSRTMRKVLSEQYEGILEKSPGQGCLALREAIARYLARNRAMQVEAEQIVIGSGAEYLYGLIVQLLGRGRVFGIESPSYEKIELIYRAAGVECELLPLAQDGIDSAALAASRADVLHTTPYRSYPSGVTATASKRHEYLRWADSAARFIIESDHDSEFSVASRPMQTLFAMAQRENVIYLNTFSKTIAAGMRVGYMVLPRRLCEAFRARLGFYSCTVPTFEQLVLTELLDSGDFERHINRVRRRARRELHGDRGGGDECRS